MITPERHAQAKQIFLAACEHPPDEQVDFVRAACGNDPELRQHIEALLVQHNSATLEPPNQPAVMASSDSSSDSFPTTTQQDSRFEAGRVIAGRYRIVACLGKGGMGEVYRADDLRLGQAVALKFLPSGLATDATFLARFHSEVRLARQVTHPNVCRVYDIGEDDGECFISMEYIDGEDLKTLLQRIGRLPGDKAIQIARELCAGLAAAHIRGVLHRDLKPANIMIDGRGHVRITDFGLAGLAGAIRGREIRAGTPAYMAPEQLAGQEVTERSDLYSLGLVLYELFTGQPAFRAKSMAGYLELHQHATPSSPSTLISDVDPAVERVILRCLEKDPRSRPESALAVAAALPGGDLLAAALAAGETPSPEMVAAAGAPARLQWPVAGACLAAFVLALIAVLAVSGKTHLVLLAGLSKAPDVLAEKAREAISALGCPDEPVDEAWGLEHNFQYPLLVQTAGARKGLADIALRLATADGADLVFWYRRSTAQLNPIEADNVVFAGAHVTPFDPPTGQPGMATVVLDAHGRLVLFEANPLSQWDEPVAFPHAEWDTVLAVTGLRPDDLKPATPIVIPQALADQRSAWTGVRPDNQETHLRIEAAAYHGQPVFVAVLEELSPEQASMASREESRRRFVERTRRLLLLLLAAAALPLARYNLRRGQGDRRGAFRLSIFVLLTHTAIWLLRARHAANLDGELQLWALSCVGALGRAALTWLFYIALEPYVRRFWPHSIIAWARLLAGRFRDPAVGRSLVVGALLGVLWALVARLDRLITSWVGLTPGEPIYANDMLLPLLGARYGLASCLDVMREGVYLGLFFVLLTVLLRVVLRRPWAAAGAAVLLISLLYVPRGSHLAVSWMTIGVVCVGPAVWALMRFGLVTVTAALFIAAMLVRFPITSDMRVWFADLSLFALAVVTGIMVLGLLAARLGGSRLRG